ncbi:hypothetical protein [Methylobacterium sp. J-070]|nr:hypothetical protein [Methylobacterium sp. J-070]
MADRIVKEKQQAARATSASPLMAYTACRSKHPIPHQIDIVI